VLDKAAEPSLSAYPAAGHVLDFGGSAVNCIDDLFLGAVYGEVVVQQSMFCAYSHHPFRDLA
jgi:hypothetical protein